MFRLARFSTVVFVSMLVRAAVAHSFVEQVDQRNDIVWYLDARSIGGNATSIVYAFYNDENGYNAGFELLGFNTNEVLLWTRPTRPVLDMEVIPGNLLYTLSMYGCKDGSSTSYLTAWSSNGSQLFQRVFGYISGVGDYVHRYIADRTTDRLALFGPTWLTITSLNGDSLTSRQLPATNFKKGTWLSSGDLLLVGDNELLRMDVQVNTLNAATVNDSVLDLRATDGGILLLYEDRVDAISNDLQPTASVPWEPSLGAPRQFMHVQDTCMVQTSTGVVLLNEELAVLDYTPLPQFPGHSINAVLPRAGGFMTAGTVRYGPPPEYWQVDANRSSGLVRSYDHDGNTTVDGPDVALEVLSLDPLVSDGASVIRDVNALVRLTNNGSDMVQNVLITYQPDPYPWFCGFKASSYPLSGLALAPGGSVELQLDNIDLHNNYQPVGGPYDLELCLWALSPNARVDRDVSDNYACGSLAPIITALDNRSRANSLVTYPNPTADMVYVKGLHGSGRFELVDLLGVAHTVHGTQGHDGVVELDLSRFPSGTYRLAFHCDRGTEWVSVAVCR